MYGMCIYVVGGVGVGGFACNLYVVCSSCELSKAGKPIKDILTPPGVADERRWGEVPVVKYFSLAWILSDRRARLRQQDARDALGDAVGDALGNPFGKCSLAVGRVLL